MRTLRRLWVIVVASAGLIACGGGSSQSANGGQGGQPKTGERPNPGGPPGAGGQAGGGGGRNGGGGRGGGAGAAIPVKAGQVKVQQVTYSIQAVGSLEAEDMIQVTAELDGVLTQVNFHEGDRVTKDTVIATIDPERYKLEADRAEANYRRAVADGESAAATYARREELAKQSLVSAEDLNLTRAGNDRSAADLAAAKAARDIANQNLSRAFVKPRRGGVIDKRLVDTGAFVRTGTTLAALVDLTRLRLRFKVSETESLKAKLGQSPKFTVAATGDREFSATIYHVGQVADPTSRQVEVLAWVQNPGVLKPGFFAEVALPSESKKDAIVVPETAIQASDRGFVAFVIQDGKAVVRQVEIGPRTGGGEVEILSGLNAGENIVFEGSDRISNGTSVNASPAGPPGRNREGGGGRPGGGRREAGAPAGTASPSVEPGGPQAKEPGAGAGGDHRGGGPKGEGRRQDPSKSPNQSGGRQ
jgi:multidrug efflux system membrane fusion protein